MTPLIPGFLWDPDRGKYFKETRELKEKLEKLSFRKKIDEMVEASHPQNRASFSITKSIQNRELAMIENCNQYHSDTFAFEMLLKRMKQGKKFTVNFQQSFGGILDFHLFNDSLAWILVKEGMLIKVILPSPINNQDDEEGGDALVQEIMAGLQDTSCLIHTQIENNDLIGAVDRSKNTIRILPRESLSNMPEMVLRVKKDISICSCEFDPYLNFVIGSTSAIHFVDWSHGESRERVYKLKGSSDVLSLFSSKYSCILENTLLCGSRNGYMNLIDTRVSHHTHPASFKANSSPVTCINNNQMIPNGYDLYTGHLNGEIKVWDLRFTRKSISNFKSLNQVKPFKFKLVDKDILLAANDAGLVESWNLTTRERLCCVRWNVQSDINDTQPLFCWDLQNRGCWMANSEEPALTLYHNL